MKQSAQCPQAQVLSTVKGALHDLKAAGQNAEFTMAFAICTYKQCKFTDGKNNPTFCLQMAPDQRFMHEFHSIIVGYRRDVVLSLLLLLLRRTNTIVAGKSTHVGCCCEKRQTIFC